MAFIPFKIVSCTCLCHTRPEFACTWHSRRQPLGSCSKLGASMLIGGTSVVQWARAGYRAHRTHIYLFSTMIVPVILGWTVQKYSYLPGVLNSYVNPSSVSSGFEMNELFTSETL
jgi:hypothetical protein